MVFSYLHIVGCYKVTRKNEIKLGVMVWENVYFFLLRREVLQCGAGFFLWKEVLMKGGGRKNEV